MMTAERLHRDVNVYCHASSGDYSSASPPDRCISTVLSAPRPTQPTPTRGYHDGHSSPFWSVGNTGKGIYHTDASRDGQSGPESRQAHGFTRK